MSNQPAMVKQADIKRAVKATLDAGVDIDRVEVEHGKVIVIAMRKNGEKSRTENSWDSIYDEEK